MNKDPLHIISHSLNIHKRCKPIIKTKSC